MSPTPLVYLDRVSKLYSTPEGTFQAVRQVTLDVQAGEFYSLLGSSGSGKTTTLRLIGGFEQPEYGQVWIGGEDVTMLPPYRRNVHTVFQSYALFPHLSVAQNIAYPLKIAKVPQAEIGPRVAEALKMFQITDLEERRPAQLSGGQQQRVALARALINRPKVLLLDEPLSALDAKIREEVRQELRDLQRQTNLTFIYVTHDQEEALALSDRIAVMHSGQVEQVGSPQEIYQRPASLFVAQFIGKANLFSGRVVELDPQGSKLGVEVGGKLLWASAPTDRPALGETLTLMVRPEQVRLLPRGESGADSAGESAEAARTPVDPLQNQFAGRVKTTTYIGQLLQVQVETALGLVTATQLGNSAPSSDLSLAWSAADAIVIPPPAHSA